MAKKRFINHLPPDLEFREESSVTGFTVAFAGTDDITERTTVTDMLDVDVLSSSVARFVVKDYKTILIIFCRAEF